MGAQLQQFMVMFACQNSVRIASDFPPRDRTKPILQNNRMNETSEIEVEPKEVEAMMDKGREVQGNPQHSGFPMPRMEIPVFEGINPRWWLRKCERMFDWYNILEGRRVTLVAAYFNDGVDAWF